MNMRTYEVRQPARTPARPVGKSAGPLRRKCACGRHTIGGGSCEACRRDRDDRRDAGQTIAGQEAARPRQQWGAVLRHPDGQEPSPPIDRSFELDPSLFIKKMEAPAEREAGKCEEFPGGSTECEMDASGMPTGKVTQRIDEKNPCTRPCVVEHEAVHVKQMKKLCPQLRDCYRQVDQGKREATECFKLAVFGTKERECEAYRVSVPCVEKRLKTAKECKGKDNQAYGERKLASERCFRDKNCGGGGAAE